MSDANWKSLFAVAAAFNLAVGLVFLAVPNRALSLLAIQPLPTLLFVQLAGGLIATFGLFYAAVARDLARREIVLLGVVGKVMAVALLTFYRLADALPETAFLLGMGDLIFAALFLWFLLGGRKSPIQARSA